MFGNSFEVYPQHMPVLPLVCGEAFNGGLRRRKWESVFDKGCPSTGNAGTAFERRLSGVVEDNHSPSTPFIIQRCFSPVGVICQNVP